MENHGDISRIEFRAAEKELTDRAPGVGLMCPSIVWPLYVSLLCPLQSIQRPWGQLVLLMSAIAHGSNSLKSLPCENQWQHQRGELSLSSRCLRSIACTSAMSVAWPGASFPTSLLLPCQKPCVSSLFWLKTVNIQQFLSSSFSTSFGGFFVLF